MRRGTYPLVGSGSRFLMIIIKVWFVETLNGLGESAALNVGIRTKRPARHTYSIKGFEARRSATGLQARYMSGMGEHPGAGDRYTVKRLEEIEDIRRVFNRVRA